MSKNLAAWTQAPPAPSGDNVVQYVSINENPDGSVAFTVRDARDAVVTATMSWPEFVDLVSEQNLAIAKHRRSTRP